MSVAILVSPLPPTSFYFSIRAAEDAEHSLMVTLAKIIVLKGESEGQHNLICTVMSHKGKQEERKFAFVLLFE